MKLFLNICILNLVSQAAMAGLFRFEITSPIGANRKLRDDLVAEALRRGGGYP